jgi:uncharacterized membrane protein
MKTWKSKVFGDNRQNFYGWIFGGLIIIGVSLWLVWRALDAGALQSAECLLLLAIYFLLVGHLALALQNYHARVAERIESEDKKHDQVDAA